LKAVQSADIVTKINTHALTYCCRDRRCIAMNKNEENSRICCCHRQLVRFGITRNQIRKLFEVNVEHINFNPEKENSRKNYGFKTDKDKDRPVNPKKPIETFPHYLNREGL